MPEKYVTAANVSDLQDGSMKQVKIGETEILLARVDGKFYATGAHCTHYGAPLAKGALCGKHVICPWHHAWFDVTNGDLLEPPALNALPHFEVQIDGENVNIKLPENPSDHRIPEMASCDAAKDTRVFAILGGGAAGYAAAQTLREDGYCGRIVMISRESRVPYDRPNLSKEYMQGKAEPEWMPLRPEEFFKKHGIELMMKKEVNKIDHKTKTISFENGESLQYDTLLIASGGKPRHLKIPGSDLKNIFVLRSFAQADEIIAAIDNAKKVVVIGASFIGMESAASLQARGLQVTVVAPDKIPFEKVLGPEIGKFFKGVHQKKGVQFRLGTGAKSFEGNGKVEVVILENGDRIETDVVIVGIGVTPATDFLEGIERRKDGGVAVDEYLKISDGLYAAGDIAHVPDVRTNETQRIEHWRYALQQGRAVAHNMAGKNIPFKGVPFFWTAHFGVSLRYLGHAKGWDEIIYDGNPEEPPFLAFYVKDDQVRAIAGIKRDTDMAYLEQAIKDDQLPRASVLKSRGVREVLPFLQGK